MAARLSDWRRDPGFRDRVVGCVIAIAAFAAGRIGTLAAWIGLAVLVLGLLVPPLLNAPGDDRRRRVMLLVSGFVAALLVSAMSSSGLALGVLGLVFFLLAFNFGWQLGQANRARSGT